MLNLVLWNQNIETNLLNLTHGYQLLKKNIAQLNY